MPFSYQDISIPFSYENGIVETGPKLRFYCIFKDFSVGGVVIVLKVVWIMIIIIFSSIIPYYFQHTSNTTTATILKMKIEIHCQKY